MQITRTFALVISYRTSLLWLLSHSDVLLYWNCFSLFSLELFLITGSVFHPEFHMIDLLSEYFRPLIWSDFRSLFLLELFFNTFSLELFFITGTVFHPEFHMIDHLSEFFRPFIWSDSPTFYGRFLIKHLRYIALEDI